MNWENEFNWLVYDDDGLQQRVPHSAREMFGSQNRSRIGRKLLRKCNLLKEETSRALALRKERGLQRVGKQEREKN